VRFIFIIVVLFACHFKILFERSRAGSLVLISPDFLNWYDIDRNNRMTSICLNLNLLY
jgi:hypothetical protein